MADPKIAQARAAGYSDAEIVDYLAANGRPNVVQAREAGYSDAEIIGYLTSSSRDPGPRPTRTGGELVGDRSLDLLSGIAAVPGMLNDPASMVRGIGGLLGMNTSGSRTDYNPLTLSGQLNAIGLAGDVGGRYFRDQQSEARQYNRENAPWYDADNLIGMGLESLPSMIVPAGAGMAAKGMGLTGRGAAAVMAATEGGQGALMSQQSTVERLMAEGHTRAEAERAAVLPSLASGAFTGLVGKALGGFETSLLSGAAGDIFSRGALGGAGRGILSEGIEESIQSGGEQFAANVAERILNPEQNLMEGVGTAALQGGVLGGLMGGGVGGIAGIQNSPSYEARGRAARQLDQDGQAASEEAYGIIERGNALRSAGAASTEQRLPALTYDSTQPRTAPPMPASVREGVDQVSWREQVGPVLDQMAQGNYETLLAEQQDREQAIAKARAGKKRMPKPFPDPVPPRSETLLKADPFTPEMGAELIRSAEAGPISPSMLKDKGIPRPADVLKILERRGFIKQTGVNETTTKLKSGKTRTNKEPVYESTAAKPPQVAGPDEGSELYIKPVPVQEQAGQGDKKGPTPKAIQARFEAARARADDTRGKLAALPQVGEDWPASRIEALESRRKALEYKLEQDEFELARAQTGRAAFAVVEKIAAPVRTGLSPNDGSTIDTPFDTDGAPRENVVHTFPTREKAQEWLDAKQNPAPPAPDIQTTPEKKTAGRNARFGKALNAALKKLGLSDQVILKVEEHLDGAEGYAETSQQNEQGQSIKMLVALARDVFDPKLTDQELLDRMMGTLHHEAIHALRSLGKFTDQEWNVLSREVKTRKKGDREYTYLQWAFDNYKEVYVKDGKPDMDLIVEEAVAEMYKDWNKAGGKLGARYTGLFNKINQFFKELFKQLRADTVLSNIDQGEVGIRDRQTQISDNQRKYLFGGIRAKNADLDALKRAASMERAGVDREAIRKDTKWFVGDDGLWRYEINDRDAVFKPEAEIKRKILGGVKIVDNAMDWIERGLNGQDYSQRPLEAVLDHPELFEAYPELRKITILVDPESSNNGYTAYSPWSGKADVIAFGGGLRRWLGKDDIDNRAMSIILHEVQHAIQSQEGFVRGANSADGMDQYRRSSGEIESRNVEARMDMTPSERWARSPDDSRDVPYEESIVNGADPLRRAASESADAMGLPVPSDRRFSFASTKSQRPPRDNYNKFLKMEKAGDSRGTIYLHTGWFRGPDGKPRYEISDNGAKLKGATDVQFLRDDIDSIRKTRGVQSPSVYSTVGEVLDHPELFEAYPFLRDVKVEFADTTSNNDPLNVGSGAMTPTRTGEPPERIIIGVGRGGVARSEEDETIKAILLHEIQHAIQLFEGMAGGGSPGRMQVLATVSEAVRRRFESVNKELVALSKNQDIDGFFKAVGSERATYTPSQIKSIEHMMGALSVMGVPPSNMSDVYKKATNFAVYKSLYGEMEARNTESRMNMTPAERLRNAPWRTSDINENQGISMTLDERNTLLAQVAAKKAAASGVSQYNAQNGFTPLETIENLQALAEKNRAAGLDDMADEMLEMASFVEPFGIRPDNIPRISDRRFSYAAARIHSRIGQVIDAQTTKKATAQQWVKTIASQPGVTKDEMDWVGFTDLLNENPDEVMTLEELKQFFEENQIALVDVKRGPGAVSPEDRESFDAAVENFMDVEGITDRDLAEQAVLDQYASGAEDWWEVEDGDITDFYGPDEIDSIPVKKAIHSAWSLPAGRGETEFLITLPGREGFFIEPGKTNQKLSRNAFVATEHFTEKNVVAHVRFKIRDDANGVPTLFIEEIQSDWHQRRKRQLMAPEKLKALGDKYTDITSEIEDFVVSVGARERAVSSAQTNNEILRSLSVGLWGPDPRWNTPEVKAEADRLIKALMRTDSEYWEQENLMNSDDIPDAPFKNNAWAKLAIRRIILEAIDNGITQISWTPGHIQAERYHVPGDAARAKANEGLAKFYDEVLTSIVGKEIKAYGGSISTSTFAIPAGREGTAHWTAPARDLRAPTFHITPQMREVANGEGFRLYSMARLRPRLDPLAAAVSPTTPAAGGKGAEEMAARYTIVQDYLAKGARMSFGRLAEADAKDALDVATTKMQDRMFPVRRMVSEVVKFGGRVTDTNDPVLADTLYTRRSQHKMDKAHENLYRPAYLSIHQIGATKADLTKLAGVSDAARLELESSHVHPSEALMNIYLYARHAPERNKFIEEVRKAREIDPDTGQFTDEMLEAGSGMTNEEAAAIMAWFDGYANKSKVEAAAKKVDAILDYTRKTRESSGLSPKWDDIVSPLVPRFQHYVPLRGLALGNVAEDWFTGDEHARTGKAFKVSGKEDRTMKGRQTYAGDMLANVIMQNQEAIVRSEKVRVGQSLARFVRDNPELTKDYLVELPAIPMQRVVINGKTRMSPKDVKGDPNYFITKENGKDVIFEVKNKRLGDSLSKIQSFGGSLPDLILSRMARLTRVMSQLQTSYNPEFLVANVLRDVQAAMIQSGQYSPEAWAPIGKKALTYAARAVSHASGRKDPEFQAKWDRLSELGGLTGVYGLTSIEDQMRTITKELSDIDPQDKGAASKAMRLSLKGAGKVFKYLEDLNDSVEAATRIAVFEAFREQGWSEERAAQAAKDMTVNFNRKGEWGPYMNAAYMFFNAATQGTATLAQAATSPRVQKVIIGIIVAGALQEMLMSALSPEDEYGTSEYDKIEDYVLEKNMIIMLGDGNYLKIPMPLGYNVFHTAGRNLARMASGKSKPLDAAMSTGSSVLSAFNPFGSNGDFWTALAPSIFRPMAETALNTDFTGKPIHPNGMPGLEEPASQSFFPSASGFSQGAADVASRLTGGDGAWTPGGLEVHPDDIDHMAGAYLGGMGRFLGRTWNLLGYGVDPQSKAVQGKELAVRDVPFYRSFAGNVSGASVRTSYDKLITPYLQFGKSVDRFEEEGNYAAVESAYTRQPERLMIYDFAADMERARIKSRRAINEIQDDPYMDDASKVQIIKQLRDEEQELMNLTIQQIRELERASGL